MSDERETVTYDDAVKMLPEKERVHTFRNPPGMLIGCDWDYADILEALKEAPAIHIAGEAAAQIEHRLVVHNKDSWLFIETKPISKS